MPPKRTQRREGGASGTLGPSTPMMGCRPPADLMPPGQPEREKQDDATNCCGRTDNADGNAARNIRDQGHRPLGPPREARRPDGLDCQKRASSSASADRGCLLRPETAPQAAPLMTLTAEAPRDVCERPDRRTRTQTEHPIRAGGSNPSSGAGSTTPPRTTGDSRPERAPVVRQRPAVALRLTRLVLAKDAAQAPAMPSRSAAATTRQAE